MSDRKGHLALADGSVFPGELFGADGTATGEVVFTTGMTGYQEVLTDPSYTGQIVTMTAPQIGNTGINEQDPESVDGRPQVAGFVVRDDSITVSNWRSRETLDAYLKRNNIVAISGVDTRRLTRYLRDKGSQNGAIGAGSIDELVERARTTPNMEGLDLVARVSPKQRYVFDESRGEWNVAPQTQNEQPLHVVAVDYGAKRNIFRCLVDSGFKVTVVPASTSGARDPARSPSAWCSAGPGPASSDGWRHHRCSGGSMGSVGWSSPGSSAHSSRSTTAQITDGVRGGGRGQRDRTTLHGYDPRPCNRLRPRTTGSR